MYRVLSLGSRPGLGTARFAHATGHGYGGLAMEGWLRLQTSCGGYSLSHGVGMDEYFALWISIQLTRVTHMSVRHVI
jgi:hypothetical protein